MKTKTQKQKVLLRLLKGRTITPLQALNWYGSLRLGAIIFELRKQYEIKTEYIKVGDHKYVARYSL